MEMTDLEFEILNSIYFVEPFDVIVAECTEKRRPVIADCLKTLIKKRWVTAMEWKPQQNEFVKTFFYDSDNMNAYQYLITKDGLMAHNSR